MNDRIAAGLATFLGRELGRTVTITHIEPVSAGARRANVLFDAETSEHTLRLVATVVPGAIQVASVAAEAAVRELAAAGGVPVPRVVAICADTSYLDAPFLLSERVEGETVPRKLLRLVQSHGLGDELAGQVGAALARLHAIDPATAPAELPGLPDGNPAARQLDEAGASVAELLPDRPVFAMALDWLAARLPGPPARRAILHTDLRTGNIIVGPDGLRAVLDWEGAQRFGDPMRDAAWPALRMWRFREDAREIGGFAGRSAFARGYRDAGGDFDDDRFRWWKVMCTLCWGLGLAGPAAAHLDGSVRNVVMAASGRRVSEIEWDLLMLIRPTRK